MNAWELPTSVNVAGVEYDIRTSWTAILDILVALASNEYEDDEKPIIALMIFYPGYDEIPVECMNEAMDRLSEFIDAGITDEGIPKPKTMDWEQDASLIIPEINKQIGNGIDVRILKDMHWWTFLGYYMGIGESTFSTVVGIRYKKAKGKALDKWEREYYKENKSLIDIRIKYTEEEKEEKNRLNELFS